MAQTEAFLSEYLKTGNIAEASRRLDIPYSEGRNLARKLREDPRFKKAREQHIQEVVAIATDAAVYLITVGIEKVEIAGRQRAHAAIAAYQKGVADLARTIERLERLRLETDGKLKTQGNVTINVSPTPSASKRIAEASGAAG